MRMHGDLDVLVGDGARRTTRAPARCLCDAPAATEVDWRMRSIKPREQCRPGMIAGEKQRFVAHLPEHIAGHLHVTGGIGDLMRTSPSSLARARSSARATATPRYLRECFGPRQSAGDPLGDQSIAVWKQAVRIIRQYRDTAGISERRERPQRIHGQRRERHRFDRRRQCRGPREPIPCASLLQQHGTTGENPGSGWTLPATG